RHAAIRLSSRSECVVTASCLNAQAPLSVSSTATPHRGVAVSSERTLTGLSPHRASSMCYYPLAMPSAPTSVDEMEVHLNELLKKFDRLKVLYEQYFMGIEKMEPLTARKELMRAIIELQQKHVRNTGLRFKSQTLIQKWNIYQGYWNRTTREIETGRYVRHLQTARRRAEQKGLPFPAEEMGLHLRDA